MVSPSFSSRRNSGQVAQSGTRLELAKITRGAHSWVCITPTGRPDCTSMVSSGRQRGEGADHRVERPPVAGRAAGAAVHDKIIGTFGVLGVEVVHQHPQRGLGGPGSCGQRGAARCAYGAGAFHVVASFLSKPVRYNGLPAGSSVGGDRLLQGLG